MDAAVVELRRRESAPGRPERGMGDTVGCRGAPSGRRNTAGSAAVVVLHRRESVPGWPELGMGDTVGCRGALSGRRNTAGSWRAVGRQVGTARMFGEGQSEWWSVRLLEVAPRIGLRRITHHRHSQRGRGSTRLYSAFIRLWRCAQVHYSFVLRGTGPPSSLASSASRAAIEGSRWIGSFFRFVSFSLLGL